MYVCIDAEGVLSGVWTQHLPALSADSGDGESDAGFGATSATADGRCVDAGEGEWRRALCSYQPAVGREWTAGNPAAHRQAQQNHPGTPASNYRHHWTGKFTAPAQASASSGQKNECRFKSTMCTIGNFYLFCHLVVSSVTLTDSKILNKCTQNYT